jgi:hypothetical protein
VDVHVRFALPDEVPVTRSIGPNNDDHWFLDATARLPGIDYTARFELPVFVVPRDPRIRAQRNGQRHD